jgi:hypothetical protein
MRASTGPSFAALTERQPSADRATPSSVHDLRCDNPRRCPYATCSRRTGTLTIFYGNLLHHLDLEIALRHQLLQPRVLLFKLLQPPHVVRLEPNRFFQV